MNRVTLIGRLGRDPEMKKTQGGTSVTNLNLATSKKIKGEEKTEWHRVVLFGTPAEIAEKYLRKGDQCAIEGELQTRKWRDQSGQDRYTTEVVVGGYDGRLHLLGGARKTDGEHPQDYATGGQASGPDRSYQDDLDSEIPF